MRGPRAQEISNDRPDAICQVVRSNTVSSSKVLDDELVEPGKAPQDTLEVDDLTLLLSTPRRSTRKTSVHSRDVSSCAPFSHVSNGMLRRQSERGSMAPSRAHRSRNVMHLELSEMEDQREVPTPACGAELNVKSFKFGRNRPPSLPALCAWEVGKPLTFSRDYPTS